MIELVNQHKEEPLYVSLYHHLRKLIEENKYVEGQKLPSKRKLAEQLKISPLTVEAAYQQLIVEGYVYAIEKKGYFVDRVIELVNQNINKRDIVIEKEEPSESFLYAFRTNVVDTSLFPNATWAKLSREVLSENHHEMLNVTHPQGMILLRKEIARYLQLHRGMSIDERQVIIGSGSSSLIQLLVELIGRDKHYAIENPGYQKIFKLYQGNNVHLSLIPLDDMGLSVESLIKSRANIVHITPSHQFPTGIVMPIQRRYELLNWANLSLNRYIIEDDYDSEFRFQGKPIPALQGIDKNETVIYMNTFTKTLAPSFRMSYMVIPRKLVLKYQELMTYHGCTVPNFEQYIMYKFMHEGFFERHINRMRKSYRQKIETIIKMVEGREWLRLKAYDTGLHFLMEVETEITEEQLVKKAKENHIDVTGLKSYNHSGQMNHHPTLVIGYSGLKSEDIEEAISLLIKVVTPNTLKDKRD